MSLNTLQDLFSFTGSIAVTLIALFLCWALFEIARLVRHADRALKDAREKAEKVERSLAHLGEKLTSSATYLGFIAEGGKQLLSLLKERREASAEPHKKKNKKNGDDGWTE